MAKVTKIGSHRPKAQIFDLTSQECIWSAAGVVPYRLCANGFDCTTCAFDHAMQRRKQSHPGARDWQEAARASAAPGAKPCRHMLSGYVPVKYCSHDYRCADCEYDQLIEQEVLSQEPPEPVVEVVAGFGLAPQHYYLPGHTWARLEYGGQVRVGLDDFAARLFGPADGWRLPGLGQAIGQGDAAAEFSRQGRLAPAASPVGGIVVAVNPDLGIRPGLASGSPYGAGWLMILQPVSLSRDLKALFYGREAEAWLEEDAGRLGEIIHRQSPLRLAAAGGRAVPDIFGAVEGLDWQALVRAFLAHAP